MDENNETTGSQGANATTPAEKAVVFVNTEVLSPPKGDPMSGIAKVMIEQSTGMMVQDLQSFLKGFEQVGLVALSRLANNFLTYGTYSEEKPHPGSKPSDKDAQNLAAGNGNDMMKDLFKIVSDYAEAKTKLSGAIYNGNPNPGPTITPVAPVETQKLPSYTDVSPEPEDAEKKNE
ncbi:hypothetical protein [Chryseobacterium sp. JUb7]|uniref:hypothetical protein n=1 Tax=Chryseobacterium sp. JUb7 TaxID=2940599 RepID=UPI002166F936|nr:hypothetical protein [Chryseobacterium sp. JUb7]MCS3528667.1 hypothetical protein [Chryseobacterium sp. JUb7]